MFVQLGDDRYTCVPPPGFEIDPAVTEAIREFDRGAIPIWRIQMWRTPWSPAPVCVVHHGIGRHLPAPRYIRRHLQIDMPADATSPAPNFLDVIFEDCETAQAKLMGGPGAYIPWTWNIYYWCRWQFDRLTASKWQAAVDRRIARLDRLRQQWQDDLDYRRRQIEPWIMRKLATLGDHDEDKYVELMWGKRSRPIRELIGDGPKPFVDLGRSPRSQRTYGRVAPFQGAV